MPQDTAVGPYHLSVHAAIGKSLREGNRGGPDLRVYVGLKWEFEAPWKRTQGQASWRRRS